MPDARRSLSGVSRRETSLLRRRQHAPVADDCSLFSAINGQPPQTTLAIPEDFVRTIMDSLGLGSREVGLNAMLGRVRRYAEEAARSN
jgi:hypothetical protein